MTLVKYNPKRLVILSRDDETMEMAKPSKTIHEFALLEMYDKDRLHAMSDVDHKEHAVATKIVPTAEYNPFECIKPMSMEQ